MKVECLYCWGQVEVTLDDVRFNTSVRCDVCEEVATAQHYVMPILNVLMKDYDERNDNV